MATQRKCMVAAVLAAMLLQGCVQTTPKWDRQFGAAVRANLAAQVLHPAAGANPDPAAGMDGRAARTAIERYEKTFTDPAAGTAPTLIQGVGK